MKDHEIAALVNSLTATAREFATAQQLRERIAGLVLPAITAAKGAAREACLVRCIDALHACNTERDGDCMLEDYEAALAQGRPFDGMVRPAGRRGNR